MKSVFRKFREIEEEEERKKEDFFLLVRRKFRQNIFCAALAKSDFLFIRVLNIFVRVVSVIHTEKIGSK